jgi:hypothetical protein
MKPLFTPWWCRTLLYICALIFFGCHKPDNPYPRVPDCQIVKLTGELNVNDSIIISYNNKGNPISMTRTNVGTGSPNYFLRYDKKNRPTDIIGAYINNLEFETWHHYVYSNTGNKNLPVTDSIYTFGTIGTGPLPETVIYGMRYSDFSYDSYNRIIKAVEVEIRPTPGTRTISYYYNAAGNLAAIATRYPEGVDSINITAYDNKINPHQTHPIWQFIDRDFSVNNPFTAISYSSYGLPTVIGGKESVGTFLGYSFNGELAISYNCHKSGY